MWLYIFNVILTPFKWIWNNIISMPIYGVTLLGIFILLAFTAALYRFVILPYTSGGVDFHTGISNIYYRIHKSKPEKEETKKQYKVDNSWGW